MRYSIGWWLMLLALAACAPQSAPAATPAATTDPLQQAAAEATAIVVRARATALVLKAQAEADALLQTAEPTVAIPLPVPSAALKPTASAEIMADVVASPTSPAASRPALSPTPNVRLVGVGFAGGGEYVHVKFYAPPALVRTWRQGMLSVIDEATGEVYNEIPVMPLIGPLLGRPAQPDQMAYVMLVNRPPLLQPGALVTVVLDKFRFEHVVVSQ